MVDNFAVQVGPLSRVVKARDSDALRYLRRRAGKAEAWRWSRVAMFRRLRKLTIGCRC